MGGTLEDTRDFKRGWDQFDLNNKKFGIDSQWEEHRYNVVVDMNKVDKHLLEKAARIEAVSTFLLNLLSLGNFEIFTWK